MQPTKPNLMEAVQAKIDAAQRAPQQSLPAFNVQQAQDFGTVQAVAHKAL